MRLAQLDPSGCEDRGNDRDTLTQAKYPSVSNDRGSNRPSAPTRSGGINDCASAVRTQRAASTCSVNAIEGRPSSTARAHEPSIEPDGRPRTTRCGRGCPVAALTGPMGSSRNAVRDPSSSIRSTINARGSTWRRRPEWTSSRVSCSRVTNMTASGGASLRDRLDRLVPHVQAVRCEHLRAPRPTLAPQSPRRRNPRGGSSPSISERRPALTWPVVKVPALTEAAYAAFTPSGRAFRSPTVRLRVGAGTCGDVEHLGREVDAVDGRHPELSESPADGPRATSEIDHGMLWIGQDLGEQFRDPCAAGEAQLPEDIVVVGRCPLAIQRGGLLDARERPGTRQGRTRARTSLGE